MSATRGFAGIVPTESGGSGGGGGAVDSVFGRTGTVSAANGDYDSYYVSLSAAQTVVAVHTFNPAVAGAPFLLGANATGQLVTGLNADKLDGSDASAFAAASHNHAASAITSGTLALARGGVNADLSATGPGYLKQASSGASITVAYPAESEVTFTDITTGNASTTKHGYLPKLPNDATKFLDGTGAWDTIAVGDLPTDARRRSFCFSVASPAAGGILGPRIPWGATVKRLGSYTDAGTVTFNIEERTTIGSAGTNILSSDQVSDTTGEEITSSFNLSTLTSGRYLYVDIASVASSPTKIAIWLEVEV